MKRGILVNQILGIMLGGAVGALFRYFVSNGIYLLLGRGFPYGTLAVNVIGSFLMGMLTILLIEKGDVSEAVKLMLLVGFLGAFTTFSTFSMDTLNLINQGQILRAFLNMFLNVGICVFSVWAGIIFSKQFW